MPLSQKSKLIKDDLQTVHKLGKLILSRGLRLKQRVKIGEVRLYCQGVCDLVLL